MEDSSYTFAIGNLLENPQKYQFSPFTGKSFLKTYYNSRKQILRSLSINTNILEIMKLVESDFSKIKKLNSNTNLEFKTEYVLINILRHIFCKNILENENKIIHVLIKKFEIRKKLFSEYDSKFSESTKHYTNLKNYLLLSIICLLKFESTQNLKLFNVSLKINDLLCSQHGIEMNEFEKILFSFLIHKEISLIDKLCIKKGVKL
jgi:hypothetical protein